MLCIQEITTKGEMMKWIRLFDLNSYFTAAGVAAAAAAASAGAAVYGGVKQKNAAEEQEDIQAQALADAQAQEQRLFEQQALDAESQGQATIEFGAIDDEDDEIGTYNDFLSPITPSKTGLGGTSNINAGLMI